MKSKTIHRKPTPAGGMVANQTESGLDSSKDAYQCICSEAEDLLNSASEQIRKNPLPAVAGAFAFGIAIGYLVMSARHTPTMTERYLSEPLSETGDAISASLSRLLGNLKFW